MHTLAVLASGRGSNFEAILTTIQNRTLKAQVVVLITDKPDARAISIAKKNGIPVELLERKFFSSREAMDKAILHTLDRFKPDLVLLAGYMRILKGPELFERYRGKILNIHPSLLPKYPGMDAQGQAFLAKEKVSGVTIHIVDESLDGGPILYQEKVDISQCKTRDEVAEKILTFEHKVYPKVVGLYLEGKIKPKN